jgi:hypothetical protein
MQNRLAKWLLRNKVQFSDWELRHLPTDYISGELIEYPSAVYIIRHHHIVWNGYDAYTLTLEGNLLYMYDATCRLAERLQWRLIRKLADWGLGNYPPEGCYPIWDDVWDRWR